MRPVKSVKMMVTVALVAMTAQSAWARPQPIIFDRACDEGTSITLGAVGDFLMHQPFQVKAEKQKTFQKIWQQWLPYMKGVDQMYGNLETPTAPGMTVGGGTAPDPGNKFDNKVHTSYPEFNVHEGILNDLVASGIDVVSTANNHALDRGPRGVEATIGELEKYHLPYTGTRRKSENEKDWSAILTSKNIKVAWLACTLVLNSADKTNQVLHCSRDWETVKAAIQLLRKRADAVIITPHWGDEGKLKQNDQQTKFAHMFLDAGATAVIGAHPHVIEPMEYYKTKDGREGFVIYSLGNFTTFNPDIAQKSTMFFSLGLTKTDYGTQINGVKYIPAFVKNRTGNSMDVEVQPIKEGKDSLADQGLAIIDKLMPAENELAFGDSIVTNSQCYER
jgi:hypothetical protein